MEQGKHIVLVVEDERTMRDILVDRFELEGFAVLAAGDGREGLQMALKHRPDIIILDILLPKMDGVTVTEALKRDVWGKTVPIVYLTNLETPPKRLKEVCKNCEFDYIVKVAARLEEVIDVVKRRLGIS